MNYPYRTDKEQAAVEHLPHSPYSQDDTPFLSTARYSLSGYEPNELESKTLADLHGEKDNLYWYRLTHEQNKAGV